MLCHLLGSWKREDGLDTARERGKARRGEMMAKTVNFMDGKCTLVGIDP